MTNSDFFVECTGVNSYQAINEDLLYDMLIHSADIAIDAIPYSDKINFRAGHGSYGPEKWTLQFDNRSKSRVVQSIMCMDQIKGYISLVNTCRDRGLLPELYMELYRASKNVGPYAAEEWVSGGGFYVAQNIKSGNLENNAERNTKFQRNKLQLDKNNTSSGSKNNSLYKDLQELTIIEDASEIKTNVDFETRMYQLASDNTDIQTAQVLDYITDGESVIVIFRLPDESMAKREYDIPDSTSGEFVTLLDVATVQHSIKDADVDLKNVEMLVGALVPIKEITGTWYVDETIDITEEDLEKRGTKESIDIDEDDLVRFISVTITIGIAVIFATLWILS